MPTRRRVVRLGRTKAVRLRWPERLRRRARSQTGDLDEARPLLYALNATSQSARRSWLFFVTLMAYLFVAASSVTHTDLLLNSPVRLPLLQVEIDLWSFFFFAPTLVLLVHFGVLLHHLMLVRKAFELDRLIGRVERDGLHSHPIRSEVSSYFFAQSLVGSTHGALLNFLLIVMRWSTLSLFPLLLLLLFQTTFLPTHEPNVTIAHRVYVLSDVVLLSVIGVAWRRSRPGSAKGAQRRMGWSPRSAAFDLPVWVGVLFFSFLTATIPTGRLVPVEEVPAGLREGDAGNIDLDKWMTFLWPAKVPFDWHDQDCVEWRGDRCAFWLTAAILERPVDFVAGRSGWLSRNIVITDRTKPPTLNGEVSNPSLRGRDLRYATFDYSDLRDVDFTAADLTGASFKGADLRGAGFTCAIKGRAFIYYDEPEGRKGYSIEVEDCPSLRRANLSGARLSDGDINGAALDSIDLSGSNLRGFDLRGLKFPRADFSGANIRGADLRWAYLAGANLSGADAEGADFSNAELPGASLAGTNLTGANLRGANLSGATLTYARLWGADLTAALLFGADFGEAAIWQTTPSLVQAYSLARTKELRLKPPNSDDLESITAAATELQKLRGDKHKSVSELLNPTTRREWGSSSHYRGWESIQSAPGKEYTAEFLQNFAQFRGDLACRNGEVLRQYVAQTSQYFSSGSVLGIGVGVMRGDSPTPPNVSRGDLERIAESQYESTRTVGGTGGATFGGFSVGTSFETVGLGVGESEAESAALLYEKLTAPDCTAARRAPSEMLEYLREYVKDLRAAQDARGQHSDEAAPGG